MGLWPPCYIQFTTCGSVGVLLQGDALAVGLEEPLPVAFVGVAQVLVLHDDHISVADLFEGAKAQGGDAELSHDQAAAAAGIIKRRRRKKIKGRIL